MNDTTGLSGQPYELQEIQIIHCWECERARVFDDCHAHAEKIGQTAAESFRRESIHELRLTPDKVVSRNQQQIAEDVTIAHRALAASLRLPVTGKTGHFVDEAVTQSLPIRKEIDRANLWLTSGEEMDKLTGKYAHAITQACLLAETDQPKPVSCWEFFKRKIDTARETRLRNLGGGESLS